MRSLPALVLLLLAGACDRFAARVEFKKGNAEYQNGNYRAALADYQRGLALDPAAAEVWRSVGLSSMALFRPGDERPENLAHARTASEAFEKYLAAKPGDEKVREYLLSTLLGANLHDRALAKLEEELVRSPQDPVLLQAIVSVMVEAGRLDDAARRLERAGLSAPATAHYVLGVACWDKAYHDPALDATLRQQLVERGRVSLEKAVARDPEYTEAMVYLNLLARERARLEPDPLVQQEWVARAVEWTDKAQEINRRKKGRGS